VGVRLENHASGTAIRNDLKLDSLQNQLYSLIKSIRISEVNSAVNNFKLTMESSMTRTTHVGSLPRSQAVVDFIFAREKGEEYDVSAFDSTMQAAVLDVEECTG